MSIEALNWALNLQLDKPVWKAVLIGIANHANPNGQAWPSVARLSLYSGFSEKTIRAAIKQMCQANWLHQELRLGTTPVYTLPIHGSPPERGTPPVEGRGTPPERGTKPNRTINKNKMQSEWMPTVTMIEFAHANGFNARRVQDEADRFRDYWISTGKPMADWEATWRNWIRRNNRVQEQRPRGFVDRHTRVASQNRTRLDNVTRELSEYEATVAGDNRQVGGTVASRTGVGAISYSPRASRTNEDS